MDEFSYKNWSAQFLHESINPDPPIKSAKWTVNPKQKLIDDFLRRSHAECQKSCQEDIKKYFDGFKKQEKKMSGDSDMHDEYVKASTESLNEKCELAINLLRCVDYLSENIDFMHNHKYAFSLLIGVVQEKLCHIKDNL